MPVSTGPDLIGSERDVPLHYLNKMRNGVVRTSEGLTDEQLRTPASHPDRIPYHRMLADSGAL
jgi:hypothetical protein